MAEGEKPQLMMPVSDETAAMRMLIEQVRRLSDAVDRFTTTMSDMQQQLARMDSDAAHAAAWREKSEARMDRLEADHDRRIGSLEGWRKGTEGRDGAWASILRHPFLNALAGLLLGAALMVWAKIEGLGQ